MFHISFWPLTSIKSIINPSNLPLKLFPIHRISIQLTIADHELKVQSFFVFFQVWKNQSKIVHFRKKVFLSIIIRLLINPRYIKRDQSHIYGMEKSFFMCRTRCTMAKLIYWLLNCVTYQNFKTEKLMNKKKTNTNFSVL